MDILDEMGMSKLSANFFLKSVNIYSHVMEISKRRKIKKILPNKALCTNSKNLDLTKMP